jgi:hypothetical protein
MKRGRATKNPLPTERKITMKETMLNVLYSILGVAGVVLPVIALLLVG